MPPAAMASSVSGEGGAAPARRRGSPRRPSASMGHRLRELRRAAEAAALGVGRRAASASTACVDVGDGRQAVAGRQRARSDPRAPVSWSACSSRSVALGVPELVDALAELDEADHPAAALLREVGAGEERAAVGRAHDRHRPAALAGHGLGGLHVDVVDVGPLLAVDLHVHEEVVHHRGHVGVLEALVGHHVAPVAGRVADRQQDRARRARPAAANASSPHGYQSTGLSACWRRYGLASSARRFTRASTATEPASGRRGTGPAVEISLEGKVALVTGASRGIGKAIAKAYADAGASVLLVVAEAARPRGGGGGDRRRRRRDRRQRRRSRRRPRRRSTAASSGSAASTSSSTTPPPTPTWARRWTSTSRATTRRGRSTSAGALVWTQLAWKRSMQRAAAAR